MKKLNLKNKKMRIATLALVAGLATPMLYVQEIKAVKRPVRTSPVVPAKAAELSPEVRATLVKYLSELIVYTKSVYNKTDEFFNKNSGKSYQQDRQEIEALTEVINKIKNELPPTHDILKSLKALATKLYETQNMWSLSVNVRSIDTMVNQANKIVSKNKLMADNLFGSVNTATKKRENGIKQQLEAAGATAELTLLLELVKNIDKVFNYDSTHHGLSNGLSKANYLCRNKGFKFTIKLPPTSPITLMDIWNGKTQLLN